MLAQHFPKRIDNHRDSVSERKGLIVQKVFALLVGLIVLLAGCDGLLSTTLSPQNVSNCNFAGNTWVQSGNQINGGVSADCYIDHRNGWDTARLEVTLQKERSDGSWSNLNTVVGRTHELPASAPAQRVGLGTVYVVGACADGIYRVRGVVKWPVSNPFEINYYSPRKPLRCP